MKSGRRMDLFKFSVVIAVFLLLTGAPLRAVFAQTDQTYQTDGSDQADQGNAAATPAEQINDYKSDITVRQDGTLDVKETITVTAENIEINHGIYRDFPTSYTDKYGNHYNVHFHLLNVGQDGAGQRYHTESLDNGIRIYIGDPDVYVDPGFHTYTLEYTVDRELGFFPDHDELYWNVTGNGWDFPIDQADAFVSLPSSVPLDQTTSTAYTGWSGATGADYTAEISTSGDTKGWTFKTTGALGVKQGLTIVVEFPKGFAHEPTSWERFCYFMEDNDGAVLLYAAFAFLLLFYLAMWAKHGRDAKRGAIIAEYEPPADFSPADVRYLAIEHYDTKALIAMIIMLARKGYLAIAKNDEGYTLTRTAKAPGDLSGEEKTVLGLFETDQTLALGGYDPDVDAAFSQTEDELKNALKEKFGNAYFTLNRKYSVVGGVLSLAAIILAVVLSPALAPYVFIIMWLSFWTTGTCAFVGYVVRLWMNALRGGGGWGAAILVAIFSIPFVAIEISFGGEVLVASGWGVGLAVMLLMALNVIFYFLLPRRTVEGRKVMDQIEGFKWFLSVTEKDLMNFNNPPDRTPELFEKFLPYALALGVEQYWAEQFADVFAGKDAQTYHPVWYSSMGDGFSVGTFASSLGSGLSMSVSSATTAPGSASGGGGGGGSGGGGGGGGGGGW